MRQRRARVVTASHDKLRVYMRARRPPCLFYLDPPFVRVNKCLVLENVIFLFYSIFLYPSYVLFRHRLLIIMDP